MTAGPADCRPSLAQRAPSTFVEPRGRSIPACFSEQVARRPAQDAIAACDGIWTYRELAGRAAAVADALPGGAPERIAILLPQGARVVAAMLGVLQRGHAFVNLDPAHAAARHREICMDAGVTAVVCDAAGHDHAGAIAPAAPRINIDGLAAAVTREPQTWPSDTALAYIMYTSGSTGRPKGVIQTHRNLLHFAGSYARSLRIGGDDRLTLFYSPAFSAMLMDVFAAVLSGAVLLPFDIRQRGLADLPDWLDAQRVTTYHSVPTVFRHLTAALEPGRRLTHIRVVDLGGEPVHHHDVVQFQHHFGPDAVLVNHLAFTEASVAAQFVLGADAPWSGGAMPAGFAGAGVRLAIEDAAGRPLPPGQTGRIVVESAYVSPGYWGDPTATAQSFREAGSAPRTFRPGDLGVIDDGGCLWHVGRTDERLKIRGHTVDPAEIESALRQLADVRDAVVRSTRSASSGEELVAFVVASGAAATASGLRAALCEQVPAYMVPARFELLEALPLTATGKVDRAALVAAPATPAPPGVAPCGPTEAMLAAIWADILGGPATALDDFFERGGDSLQAARMMIAIEKACGVRLPLAVTHTHPTLRGLAEAVDRAADASTTAVLVPMQAVASGTPLFLVPGVGGHPLRYRDFGRALGASRPVYSFQFPGLYDDSPPLRTVPELAECLYREIRSCQPSGPYCLAGYSSGGVIAIEIAQRLRDADESIACLVLLDAYPLVGRVRRSLRRGLHILRRGPRGARRGGRRPVAHDRGTRHAVPAAVRYLGLQRVLRANQRACVNYRPRVYEGPIDLYRARVASDGAVPAGLADYGWSALLGGPITVHAVDGDHATMIEGAHAVTLATQVEARIIAGLQAVSGGWLPTGNP